MKFENTAFERGARLTLGTLAKLQQSLMFKNGTKGLQDVEKQGSRFNLGPVSTSIDGVGKRFGTMATVAFTALSNITNRAVDSGIRIGKALTINPLKSGLA